MKTKPNETLKSLRETYKCLRVGQHLLVDHPGARADRVIGVGRKWIRTLKKGQVDPADVFDWWRA